MLTTIQDAVKSLLPAKRKINAASGWTSFNAPCCHHRGESADTRGRGGFIFGADGTANYHCFNCQFKANYTPGRHLNYKFRKLLSWLGAGENEVKRLVIDAIRVRDLVAPETVKIEEKEEVNFKVRLLPDGAKSFSEWRTFLALTDDSYQTPTSLKGAVEYISKRGGNLIDRYEFYTTDETDHNYHKRVIIPCYWHGQLVGSTARTFDDGIKPKYYSDYEPGYVFNVDQQTADKKFVIVVEGPFDAMAVDGVAVMSNECSEVQADIIDSLGREVIVVPDRDRAGAKLVNQAIEYGWSVSYPIWQETCKDVSEAVVKYGKLFVLKAILEGKESSRLKIELKKKGLS
jgi:5S rRNA maturation endonuclease (ribonuclease M5)